MFTPHPTPTCVGFERQRRVKRELCGATRVRSTQKYHTRNACIACKHMLTAPTCIRLDGQRRVKRELRGATSPQLVRRREPQRLAAGVAGIVEGHRKLVHVFVCVYVFACVCVLCVQFYVWRLAHASNQGASAARMQLQLG